MFRFFPPLPTLGRVGAHRAAAHLLACGRSETLSFGFNCLACCTNLPLQLTARPNLAGNVFVFL